MCVPSVPHKYIKVTKSRLNFRALGYKHLICECHFLSPYFVRFRAIFHRYSYLYTHKSNEYLRSNIKCGKYQNRDKYHRNVSYIRSVSLTLLDNPATHFRQFITNIMHGRAVLPAYTFCQFITKNVTFSCMEAALPPNII